MRDDFRAYLGAPVSSILVYGALVLLSFLGMIGTLTLGASALFDGEEVAAAWLTASGILAIFFKSRWAAPLIAVGVILIITGNWLVQKPSSLTAWWTSTDRALQRFVVRQRVRDKQVTPPRSPALVPRRLPAPKLEETDGREVECDDFRD